MPNRATAVEMSPMSHIVTILSSPHYHHHPPPPPSRTAATAAVEHPSDCLHQGQAGAGSLTQPPPPTLPMKPSNDTTSPAPNDTNDAARWCHVTAPNHVDKAAQRCHVTAPERHRQSRPTAPRHCPQRPRQSPSNAATAGTRCPTMRMPRHHLERHVG